MLFHVVCCIFRTQNRISDRENSELYVPDPWSPKPVECMHESINECPNGWMVEWIKARTILLEHNQLSSRSVLHVCRWGSESLKRCYSLCQHMMHFFHQYLLYVTFEVLEPLWHTMSSQCRTANTLDEELPCSHLLLSTSLGCV